MTWFVIDPEGYRYPIGQQGLTLGRAVDNDVVLNDTETSRHHASIQIHEEQAWLYDLESSNGVFVNDVRIPGTYRLQSGDIIRLGTTNLTASVITTPGPVPVAAPAPTPAPAPPPQPSTFYQILPAILTGVAIGMVGLALVVLFVVRPLVSASSGSPDPTPPSHSVYTDALQAIAFLDTPIEGSSNSIVGTGIVVSENGRILTAYNAVYDPTTQRPYNRNSQVRVGLSTVGGGQAPNVWYRARVVRADKQRDIAILQIFSRDNGSPLPNSFRLSPAPLDQGLTLQLNEPIAVISYMGGIMETQQASQAQTLGIGEGQVKGFIPDVTLQAERGWIQSDIGLSTRNIGGMGLDQQGNVIGLYTGANTTSGSGLLRPIEYAQPLLAGS